MFEALGLLCSVLCRNSHQPDATKLKLQRLWIWKYEYYIPICQAPVFFVTRYTIYTCPCETIFFLRPRVRNFNLNLRMKCFFNNKDRTESYVFPLSIVFEMKSIQSGIVIIRVIKLILLVICPRIKHQSTEMLRSIRRYNRFTYKAEDVNLTTSHD